jgi:hypothetical protein
MMFKIYTTAPIPEIPDGTRSEYIGHFLSTDHKKLISLEFLIRFCNEHNHTSVLSLGSGQCVIEHLLGYALPSGSRVVATDINLEHINIARKLFPNIIAKPFDFCADSIEDLHKVFDVAYLMGSAYVMTDDQYVSLLKQLKAAGVKHIIDFQPAYVPYHKLPITILGELKCKVFKTYRGRFHGYQRTVGHIRRLYRKAGLTIVNEPYLPTYNNYVAVLRSHDA